MKPLLFLLTIVLTLTACKKEPVITKQPEPNVPKDFALIPMKDAQWTVHCVGFHPGPLEADLGYDFFRDITNRVDSATHIDFITKATGRDTVIKGVKYYFFTNEEVLSYSLPLPAINNDVQTKYNAGTLLLREDTLGKTVLMYQGNYLDDILIVDLKDEEAGKRFSGRPEMEIKYIDSLKLGNSYIKRWQSCNVVDKNMEVLHKAYGIGTYIGLLYPSLIGTFTDPKEIDFTYKSNTIHLNYNY